MSPPDIADYLSFLQSIYYLSTIEYYFFVITNDHLKIYARHMYPTPKNIPMLTVMLSQMNIKQIKYRIREKGNTVLVCRNIIQSMFKFATFGKEQCNPTIQ